jgi:hypothetical protein
MEDGRMTVRDAIIQSGQLVLANPLPFPDGTRVKISVEPTTDDPLLFLANHAVATGVKDLAEQHDHYLYGTPKETR